jgi:hypothetical protein
MALSVAEVMAISKAIDLIILGLADLQRVSQLSDEECRALIKAVFEDRAIQRKRLDAQ